PVPRVSRLWPRPVRGPLDADTARPEKGAGPRHHLLRLDGVDTVVHRHAVVNLLAEPRPHRLAAGLGQHGFQVRGGRVPEMPATVVFGERSRENVPTEALLQIVEDERGARVDERVAAARPPIPGVAGDGVRLEP